MNGNPLSFQFWTNQQMVFRDIKYHIKVWYHLIKKSHLCNVYKGSEGICPYDFVPNSKNINTTSNALLVKMFALQYIQPVSKKDVSCTLMMMENLAKPKWISVPCAAKILGDIVCVKENQVNKDKSHGFYQKLQDFEVTLTLFQCTNGKIISSMWQCNGFKDCSTGEDEKSCSCLIKDKLSFDSHYCRYNCKKPECICSELFFQSHTIGCFQYKPLVTVNNRKTENSKIKTKVLFSCPNESLRLDEELVNDLIPDCKSNADENILHKILKANYIYNMTHISSKYNTMQYRHCFEGHPKMYHLSKECIYTVDQKGILQTCRNGKHLQNCSNFNCEKYFKFKCPRYYCIPMGHICDGKIDCP